MPRHAISSLLLFFCLGDLPRAQTPDDLTPRFLLLSTLRVSTLEKELKQAAGSGYRVLFASNQSNGGQEAAGLPQAFTERSQLVLEKSAAGNEKYDYVFLKTRGQSPRAQLDFLATDMSEAAKKGYKFIPQTFLGLMEKRESGDSAPPLTYRILQGSSKHLQEEICKASEAEFRFLDLLDNVIVMGKSSATTDVNAADAGAVPNHASVCPYLIVGTRTEGALRKEIAAGVSNGFRIVAASAPGEIVVVMEKVAAAADGHEYIILDSMRTEKLRRDVQEASGRGFRAVPRAFFTYSVTTVLLMEKGPTTANSHDYQILRTQKSSTLQKELSQSAGQGFSPVAMSDSRTLLLQKP